MQKYYTCVADAKRAIKLLKITGKASIQRCISGDCRGFYFLEPISEDSKKMLTKAYPEPKIRE